MLISQGKPTPTNQAQLAPQLEDLNKVGFFIKPESPLPEMQPGASVCREAQQNVNLNDILNVPTSPELSMI